MILFRLYLSSVHYVRDSGVVSVEVLDSQLPKHWTLCQQMGDSVILRLTEWAEGLYRAVKFAKMVIETSMASQNLNGRSKVEGPSYSSGSNP